MSTMRSFLFRFLPFLLVCLLLGASSANAQTNNAEWVVIKRQCGLLPSLAYNTWLAQGAPCPARDRGAYGGKSNTYDNGAAAREAEAARAEKAAEDERIAAEKRKKADAAIRQAEFEKARDDAAKTLKGSIGTSISPTNGGLKGSSDYGLKGAVSDQGLKGSSTPTTGQSKQVVAWTQLHCAASIAGYALSALQTKGDYNEFGTLSTEALKALDGQRPSVECSAAPPFPDARGKAVDMELVKTAERQLLERAGAIAERMKQRQADAPSIAPAGAETPDEKMRRVQKELNVVNSQKITGKPPKQVDQQEKDRKELAKLVLVNNGLEKGDFSSVGVDISEKAPRKPREPPSPTKP